MGLWGRIFVPLPSAGVVQKSTNRPLINVGDRALLLSSLRDNYSTVMSSMNLNALHASPYFPMSQFQEMFHVLLNLAAYLCESISWNAVVVIRRVERLPLGHRCF